MGANGAAFSYVVQTKSRPVLNVDCLTQNEFCLLQLGVFIIINNSKPTKQGSALVVSLSFFFGYTFRGTLSASFVDRTK